MRSWIALSGMFVALVLPGCVVAVDHHRGYDDDSAILSVDWSIDGSSHPRACSDFGAAYAYVTIESHYGVEDFRTIDCERFGYDFYLPAGRYWVTVVLLNRFHDHITSTVRTDARTLYAGDGDFVVADFPEDAFL